MTTTIEKSEIVRSTGWEPLVYTKVYAMLTLERSQTKNAKMQICLYAWPPTEV